MTANSRSGQWPPNFIEDGTAVWRSINGAAKWCWLEKPYKIMSGKTNRVRGAVTLNGDAEKFVEAETISAFLGNLAATGTLLFPMFIARRRMLVTHVSYATAADVVAHATNYRNLILRRTRAGVTANISSIDTTATGFTTLVNRDVARADYRIDKARGARQIRALKKYHKWIDIAFMQRAGINNSAKSRVCRMKRDDCTVYFDSDAARLVYIGRPADEEYWDDHWIDGLSAGDVKRPNRFVVRETQRWLPAGARVIDGGCGLAHSVFSLKKAGFDAYGIDYAERTVSAVKRVAPDLQVSVSDVRSMPDFADGFFDGYWSLGVVEHFFDGFDQIAAEIYRVIRPGGYAFVTVPSMSPLRRMKARAGGYPTFNGDSTNFYQFVLPPSSVIDGFQRHGFTLRSMKGRGGVKGLKDEVSMLRPTLQRLFDSRNRAMRAVKFATDLIATPFSFHTKFYVFQK